MLFVDADSPVGPSRRSGTVAEHNQSTLAAADAARLLGRIVRARRKRAELFGEDLFAEPAWDILLELSLARLQTRAVTADLLFASVSVDESTAARWIEKLAQDGWIRRTAARGDKELVELSPKAIAVMHSWVSEWIEDHRDRSGDRSVASLLERIERGTRDSSG